MQQPDISALPPPLLTVCQRIVQCGGRAWLVGGSVRDMLLGRNPKDFDVEVYGLTSDTLISAVKSFGRCEEVGRQFGVIKLWTEGMEIDLALPRIERKAGSGHCAFDVHPDPNLDEKTASERRDFTINAMMLDPLTDELLDFHAGRRDLELGILRHVSPAFSEDPLRPLRAMQFAARFRLTLDGATASLCHALLGEADTLPAARIWEEWRKWAHAPYPSFGLDALQASGWLSCYPELAAMIGCEQEKEWHPEGDVWTHTKLVVDQAADIAERCEMERDVREYFIFAALCHDLGKPATTFTHDNHRIRSTGHSEAGEEPARSFLAAIGAPKCVSQYVIPLTREHLVHLHGQPTPRAVRRLSHRLEPASIELWESLVEADASGRAPHPPARPALSWLEQARQMEVQNNKPKPFATGKMLLDMGMKQGPEMGRLLAAAYEAQLDGEFDDADSARQWLADRLGKD